MLKKCYKVTFHRYGDKKAHSYVGALTVDRITANIFGKYHGQIERVGKYEYAVEELPLTTKNFKKIYILSLFNEDRTDLVSKHYFKSQEARRDLQNLPTREYFELESKVLLDIETILFFKGLEDCLTNYRIFNEDELKVLKDLYEKKTREELKKKEKV